MDSRMKPLGNRRLFSRLVIGVTTFLIVIPLFMLVLSQIGVRNRKSSLPIVQDATGRCEDPLRTSRSDGKFYLHYIRFKPDGAKSNFDLRFTDYLSILSGVQNLKPDAILVHGDAEPTGHYWNNLKSRGWVRHVHKNLTTFVGRRQEKDKEIGFKEHSADIAKLDVLLEYGGVVVDFDVFFIRGERIKQILQNKKAIVCYGDADGHNIGFVAGRQDSKLLWAWRRSYADIYVNDWNFNQAFVSLTILYKEEAYLANGICNNPHPDRNLHDYFYDYGKISWVNSMAIHSYERFGAAPITKPEDLRNGPLTTHKELLLTVYEDRPLPPYDSSFRDELDPLQDDCIR